MELKSVNTNGENVVASNINSNKFYSLKIVKTKLKNKHHMLIFL